MQRRNFLAGLGAATAGLPFLRPSSVFAQERPVKKIIFFLTKNGPDPARWYRARASDGLASSEQLQPLAPLAEKLVLVQGLDNLAAQNNAPDHQPDYKGLMGGWQAERGARRAGCSETTRPDRCYAWNARGTSIDLFLGDDDRVRRGSPYATMHLGVRGRQSGNLQVSFRGTRSFFAENDPFRAFDRYLSGPGLDDEARQRIRARQTLLLDAVRDDVRATRGRLGCEHREAFDQHIASIEELETSLEASCTTEPLGAAFDPSAFANMPRTAALQRQILVRAMGCGLTNVGVLELCNGDEAFPFAPISFAEGNWHNYIHGNGASEEDRMALQRRITRWFATQLADLLADLERTPDVGGTRMLDNTVVVWLHEQGKTTSHRRTDIPVVLAGSCGGYFRSGGHQQSYLAGTGGRSHNGLLVTLCHAMGLTDVDRYGQTGAVGSQEFDHRILSELRA